MAPFSPQKKPSPPEPGGGSTGLSCGGRVLGSHCPFRIYGGGDFAGDSAEPAGGSDERGVFVRHCGRPLPGRADHPLEAAQRMLGSIEGRGQKAFVYGFDGKMVVVHHKGIDPGAQEVFFHEREDKPFKRFVYTEDFGAAVHQYRWSVL